MATVPDPDRAQILARLRSLTPNRVNVDPLLLQPGVLLEDIGIDSFSMIELIFLAEEEFSIKIPLEGLEVKTVDDVLDVIQRLIAKADQPGSVRADH